MPIDVAGTDTEGASTDIRSTGFGLSQDASATILDVILAIAVGVQSSIAEFLLRLDPADALAPVAIGAGLDSKGAGSDIRSAVLVGTINTVTTILEIRHTIAIVVTDAIADFSHSTDTTETQSPTPIRAAGLCSELASSDIGAAGNGVTGMALTAGQLIDRPIAVIVDIVTANFR